MATRDRTEREGDAPPGHRPARTSQGLYLFGVVRARAWRSRGDDEVVKVRHRDLEALVRPTAYRIPELDDQAVRSHQRRVDSWMRRGTILPVPYGLVFRGRRAVVRFLEDQYIALDEGLAFLDGHWELRLHVAGDPEDGAHREVATRLYSELRRFARAALPLQAGDSRILSAAFLVDRSGWIRFVERGDELGSAHPELALDITGPWPPYDFVTLVT